MRASRSHLTAELRSARKPTEDQLHRFEQFLSRTYKRKVPLRWEQDVGLSSGFRLRVGSDVYDWTLDGRIWQFTDYLRQIQPGQDDLLPLMRHSRVPRFCTAERITHSPRVHRPRFDGYDGQTPRIFANG